MIETFLPVSEPSIGESELSLVSDAVRSGWVSSLGKYIPEFEQKFATFCGTKHAVSVFNGTVALHLALVALGIKPGDEVIVPSLTFVATMNAVLYCGATPVFADSEPTTWNIDPIDIEKRITRKTKAIIVVHLYGHPAQMDAILKIARKHKLKVIEDAAESHGALYKGKKVGSLGDVGCFSFYGNKVITTGEGGMIVTNNKKLAESMQFLKDHAMSATRKYFHPVMGFNYRLTNLQAALGVAQMTKIDRFIVKKRHVAQEYNRLLSGLPGIVLPPETSWAKNVYWMYSILVTPDAGLSRDDLAKELKKRNIDSRPFFVPNHKLPYLPAKTRNITLPNAETLSAQGMNLPSSVLVTDEQIAAVCSAIKEILLQSQANRIVKDKRSLTLTLSVATKKDGKKIATFFRSLSIKSRSTFQPHALDANFAHKIATRATSANHIRLFAHEKTKGKIVGYAFLARPFGMLRSAYFGVAVSDTHQGRGISSLLMNQLFMLARLHGLKHIYLNVYANNIRAIAAYQKRGFTRIAPPLLLSKIFTLSELWSNGEFWKTVLKFIGSKNNQPSQEKHTQASIWMKKTLP
jgi:perosamine synthetase